MFPSPNPMRAPRVPSVYPRRFCAIGPPHALAWDSEKSSQAIHPDFVQLIQDRIPPITSKTEVAQLVEKFPPVQPALFVFHCSRCGSTLLARLLELEKKNRVFIEPEVIDWIALAKESREDRIEWIRLIIYALGIGAVGGQNRLIVKFSSLAMFFLSEIEEAFPETEWIYMHREPGAVMSSNLRTRSRAFRVDSALADLAGLDIESIQHSDDSEKMASLLEKNLLRAIQYQARWAGIYDYARIEATAQEILSRWTNLDFGDPLVRETLSSDSKSGKRFEARVPPESQHQPDTRIIEIYRRLQGLGVDEKS